MKKTILCIAGTRPEIVKMAPVVTALRQVEWANVIFITTGQHRELVAAALASFGLEPDFDLAVMTSNQTLASLTARLLLALENIIQDIKPDLVVAQGDTTTVFVTALTCFYLNIPFAHVEAGLRTGHLHDPFPEEFNRTVCGRLAAIHFAPSERARDALRKEGISDSQIILTGNTVIDALFSTSIKHVEQLENSLKTILLTAHRRENFGAPLEEVFRALKDILLSRSDVQLLYPVHPNPNVNKLANMIFAGVERAHLCEPMDYATFVGAMRRAYLIVTDSGGVQEEAPALGVPVIVIRNETERPEAVDSGAARLVGTGYFNVRSNIEEILDNKDKYDLMSRGYSPYGDAHAADRIVDSLEVFFGLKQHRNLADFKPGLLRRLRSEG